MDEKKKFRMEDDRIVEMTFEELYAQFFNWIKDDTYKFKKQYGNLFSLSEIEQQFTIELWKAFNSYDVDKYVRISTHVYYRFAAAKRDLKMKRFKTKKSKFYNSMISIDSKIKDKNENIQDLYNMEFDEHKVETPEDHLLRREIMDYFVSTYTDEEDFDLILVIMDRKTFSVKDYAEKYNISRQLANKKVNRMKNNIKERFKYAWQ